MGIPHDSLDRWEYDYVAYEYTTVTSTTMEVDVDAALVPVEQWFDCNAGGYIDVPANHARSSTNSTSFAQKSPIILETDVCNVLCHGEDSCTFQEIICKSTCEVCSVEC